MAKNAPGLANHTHVEARKVLDGAGSLEDNAKR